MTRTFTRHARPFLFSMLAATVLLAMPATATAQNLLTNPNFDTTIAGWTATTPASVAFDGTLDANSSLTSGSLRWTFTVGASPGDIVIATQCVTGIVPGTAYDVSGAFRLETMQPGSSANLVAYFGDAACAPFVASFPEAGTPIAAAVGCCAWTTTSLNLVAPPTAASLTLGLVAGGAPFGPGTLAGIPTTVPGQYVVNIDSLNVSATPIVPTMGPLWLAALAALLFYVVWSRRHRQAGAPA